MKNYCAIDLHSNNNVIVVIDEKDNILLERKLSNNLGMVLDLLSTIREPIRGIAVEFCHSL
jgi:hypothetical protein